MTARSTHRSAPRWMAVVRVLLTGPAMLASVALILALLGWAGSWAGALLLVWALPGLGLATPPGEWLAARVHHCHRPPPAENGLIASPWTAALRRCHLDPNRYQLYVRGDPSPNAYALGHRSVVVTDGLL